MPPHGHNELAHPESGYFAVGIKSYGRAPTFLMATGGRLTLNVLLSFAQFEREVTSERIRDKIAASKRKGLWVGGIVPLGHTTKDPQDCRG